MAMSMQEIFDKVVLHLRTQKVPSLSKGKECMYRTDTGLMCAVGCLIPDELYTKEIENVRAADPEVLSILEKAGVLDQENAGIKFKEKVYLLSRFQIIHDVTLTNDPLSIEKAFEELAEMYGLQYPPIEVTVNG